jgi:homoserine trans-succinylase
LLPADALIDVPAPHLQSALLLCWVPHTALVRTYNVGMMQLQRKHQKQQEQQQRQVQIKKQILMSGKDGHKTVTSCSSMQTRKVILLE